MAYNKWQERKHQHKAEPRLSDHRDVLLEPRVADDDAKGRAARTERREPGIADDDGVADGPRPARGVDHPIRPRSARVARRAHGLRDPSRGHRAARCATALAGAGRAAGRAVEAGALVRVQRHREPVVPDRPEQCGRLPLVLRAATRRSARLDRRVRLHALLRGAACRRHGDGAPARPARAPKPCATPPRSIVSRRRGCADRGQCRRLVPPFDGSEIAKLAARHGFTLSGDGSFHALADDGSTLFTLANLEPGLFAAETLPAMVTGGLTLVIDVPWVQMAWRPSTA